MSTKRPTDRFGKPVSVGDKLKLLKLSGDWFDNLPEDERPFVESMIGEIFEVEEIDEYGSPWIRKSWRDETDEEASCFSHSIAVAPDEIELVDGAEH